ncbi:MAG: hypothetical protein Q9219_006057 [cf. Caloplaca sp. 3 TL-2023]
MSDFDQFLFDEQLDNTGMNLGTFPDFPDFEENIAAYEAPAATVGASALNPFLVGDAASMNYAAALEAPKNQDWQPTEPVESSIDPALLNQFDPSLDLFLTPPSLDEEWQPLPNTETSIPPTFVNPFDTALDPLAVQAPSSTSKIIFPSQSPEFYAPTFTPSFSPEIPSTNFNFPTAAGSHTIPSRHPAARPDVQPRVDGSNCPCSLCRGAAVRTSTISARVQKPSSARKQRKAMTKAKAKAKEAAKRKAIEEILMADDDDDSDSELSELDSDDVEEWGGFAVERKGGVERRRRRRSVGKGRERAALPRKMPRGLEISMNGW